MLEAPTQRLTAFVQALEERVARCPDAAEQVRITSELLHEVLHHDDVLSGRLMVPRPDHYARYRVYCHPQDRLCVVAMVWAPGQHTPIHDHGGVWCVEGIHSGRMHITRYHLVRHEAGQDGERYHFDVDVCVAAGVGEVGRLIPPSEYHRMANDSESLAVSLHVYGQELRHCHRFLRRDDGIGFSRVEVPLLYDGIA